MNCFHCKNELVWQNDFTYEDFGLEGDGIINVLHCHCCNATVEVYFPLDEIQQ